jgi:predicted TIM-barrel fold metal-dependent hydrolase
VIPSPSVPAVIDAFPHILPKPLFERMVAVAETPAAQNWLTGSRRQTGLYDLDLRFRVMDNLQQVQDYRQVLTLATPPLEQVASGATLRDLTRLANDQLAELCQRHPDRFLGFAAGLPMDDPDAAVQELDRAVNSLGALGAQIFTNVNGHALDEPRFEPLFARFSELDKTIWVHGARSFIHPEFVGDEGSRYGLWLSLGWPYEMAMFMARIVIAGVLERYPDLRILTHHGGGMIPTFGQRVGASAIGFQGPEHQSEFDAFARLSKSPLEYFKQFYADTTVGAVPRTIRASIDFFGIDHVMFGSDWPFGPPTEQSNIVPTLNAIEALGLSAEARAQLLSTNALRVLGLTVLSG